MKAYACIPCGGANDSTPRSPLRRRAPRGRGWALPALLLALAGCSATVAPPRALDVPRPVRRRPAAPAAPPGRMADGECRCWRGTVSGNDPGVVAHLYLCRKGELLSGTARYDSPRSGASVREVSGRVAPEESTLSHAIPGLGLAGVAPRGSKLLLRDERIVQSRAAAGWRFCLVDAYELNLDAKTGELAGSYRSEGCRDYALLHLAAAMRARCLLSALRRQP